MQEGRVTRIESKDIYVISNDGSEIRCVLPGKIKNKYSLKKNKLNTLDIVAVGDFVKYSLKTSGNETVGIIEEIAERNNYVSRKAPKIRGRGEKGKRLEQIVAANVDKLIIVTSIANPPFNNRFVDRMLVIAESSEIEPLIIINKIDLDENNTSNKWKSLYESIGYKILEISVKEKLNVDLLQSKIQEGKFVFWGQSGVGKSSLLNHLFPGLNLKTGEISDYSKKGKHTTVTAKLIQINSKVSVIDTPGIREIEPYGISKNDLGHYFIEFLPFISDCKFNTCTHFHEPGCAVRTAVEQKKIHKERYQSYLNLLQSIEE